MRIFWISALITFFLDRITKVLILKSNFTVLKIVSFLNLVKVWNTGIVFGLFSGHREIGKYIWIGVVGFFLGAIFSWARTFKNDRTLKLAIVILFGGGLGNLADRFLYGAVFDFIDFHIQNYHWPAFNIADAGITVAIFFILLKYARG